MTTHWSDSIFWRTPAEFCWRGSLLPLASNWDNPGFLQFFSHTTEANHNQNEKEKLSNNNHSITLQIDGHSPNLVASNYITKTENVHSKTSLKRS
jgi:hypothetical protein